MSSDPKLKIPPDPERAKVRKRSQTILKKVNELASVPGVHVYVLITSKWYQIAYNSDSQDGAQWPPADTELDNIYKDLRRETPQTMKREEDQTVTELKRLLRYFERRKVLLSEYAK